ncbi:hypothetical protein S40293_08691 [Stachybotrys chartarum IBT 40293]|nr:hypothetical protein S40293_08691 [Stachybotrys chartarum IBT 40293]
MVSAHTLPPIAHSHDTTHPRQPGHTSLLQNPLMASDRVGPAVISSSSDATSSDTTHDTVLSQERGSETTAMSSSSQPALADAHSPGPEADVASVSDSQSGDSQLHQLSALAATRRRLSTADNGTNGARKRMADGEVKPVPDAGMSPARGHSRNTSTVSVASTTGSNIGDLTAQLRTRLSYAMVKVNNGWHGHTVDELESLASQAASPTSSTSTAHRRHGSSASPRVPLQVHFAADTYRTKSNSPPQRSINHNRPTLAPPAPIQPSTSTVSNSNPRRNSNPRMTPTLRNAYSASASPHTPAQQPRLNLIQARSQGVEGMLYSPHQNVREQDAIETLLFMSSPSGSANLKHTFSPAGSPAPQSLPPRTTTGRHALPSGPRKTLPNARPTLAPKKPGMDRSPGMQPPGSPMNLDSPQQPYATPNRGTPRRRTIGSASHIRGTSLSISNGLTMGNGTPRRTLRDEDIERMLDRATAERSDSSDDEEIPLRPNRGVAGAMEA